MVLARVCRQIGQLNNSYYYDENGNRINRGHIVDRKDVFNAMETLIPNNIVRKHFAGIGGLDLYDLLRGGTQIAMLGGYYSTETPNAYEGHAWVCDGGRKTGYYDTLQLIGGETAHFAGYIYLHYNWGWGGMDNGYFLSTIFNPSKGYKYDNPGDGYSNVNYDQLRWFIILKK